MADPALNVTLLKCPLITLDNFHDPPPPPPPPKFSHLCSPFGVYIFCQDVKKKKGKQEELIIQQTIKQCREKRLEARQLLGNLTSMEVVGQNFGSLVKENDRVTLVDSIYAVFNFLLILHSLLCGYYKKCIFPTILRGGSRKFRKGRRGRKLASYSYIC